MDSGVQVVNLQQILEHEAQAILNIPEDGFEKALDIIEECTNLLGGKVIVSGVGKAGQIALSIATTLASTGTPAIFLHPTEAQHGDLGMLQDYDCMILISNSGKTREIIELGILANDLIPSIPIIAITSDQDSELAASADVALMTGAPDEVCPLGLSPTTSTTVMGVIGDILVVKMMRRIGFSKREYSLRHHGGYLGKRSRT